MIQKYILALIFISSLVISSCSSTKELESLPADVRYQRAKDLFDEENYLEAIEEFKIVTVQYQGSEYADDAQFYLSEARFQRGEYILASSEYDNLVRLMPNSPFTPQARYKKALAHYLLSPKPQLDQKYTKYAIDDFQTFIEFTPQDSLVTGAEEKISELTEKLSRKIFESGRLYFRMNYYRAAIAYFDKVISEYNDTQFADDAMLWKARAQIERKDFPGAKVTLDAMVGKYPSSELLLEVEDLRKNIMQDESEFRAEQQNQFSKSHE